MDLLDLAPDAVARAAAAGAEAAEAFAIRYRTRHVYVEADVPKVAEAREECGLGLRVLRGKRAAFASTTLAGAADLGSAVRRAMRVLRQIPEDPDLGGLPTGGASTDVPGVWDAATADASVEDLLEGARAFTDAVKGEKGASVPKATFRLQDFEARIVNSGGVAANHRGTLVYAYLTATSGSGKDVGEGILHGVATAMKAMDFAAMGRTCARRAEENRRSVAFRETLTGVAVIDPQELGALFLQTVATAANGQDVVRKRSPWVGRLGEAVGSATLTIRDRPRMPGGIQSCAVDDEGTPTADRAVVEGGVLREFVADHYYARLLGCRAGNGLRRSGMTLEGAYGRPAQADVSNLVVEPGTKSVEDLVAGVDRGVYVEKFAAPEANPISGTFGCEVRNATLIEKGELTRHVKYALLSGNFYEGLKHVEGIGRDPEAVPAFYGSPGCAYVPAMAFSGFELVGQK